jgi:heat shock protein HslJ
MRKIGYLLITIAFIVSGSMLAFGQGRSLAGTEWKLIEAHGRTVRNSLAGIEFSENGSRFTGNTGCNQMFGSFDLKGRNIDFQGIGATKKMCKMMPGSLTENDFLKALRATSRLDRSGDTLRLMDRRGRNLLTFRSVKNDRSSIRLESKKWVLEQIKGRQTFVPLPYAFINFDAEKGTAGGNTSCNVFGGDYSVRGSSITFSNMISTMRACIEDNKMSVERDMLDGLRAARRFEIRDGRLHIYRGNELLLTFRPENK